MLRDILRFNGEATRIARAPGATTACRSAHFLESNRYGDAFRRLVPAADGRGDLVVSDGDHAAHIRSRLSPASAITMGCCRSRTGPSGSRCAAARVSMCDRIASRVPDVRLDDEVLAVRRDSVNGQVVVKSRHASESYDHVVLACHSDQSLALLADADESERGILGAVKYQRNRAVLHRDIALLPKLRSVWSSWNYMSDGGDEPNVSVTYLLNKLQPLPFSDSGDAHAESHDRTSSRKGDCGVRLHAPGLRRRGHCGTAPVRRRPGSPPGVASPAHGPATASTRTD